MLVEALRKQSEARGAWAFGAISIDGNSKGNADQATAPEDDGG
jgi:hypothetical protein